MLKKIDAKVDWNLLSDHDRFNAAEHKEVR